MTQSRSLTLPNKSIAAICPQPPAVIEAGGNNARVAWDEFFAAQIRNPHTRTAYRLAIRKFFVWLEPRNIALADIEPGAVGEYFAQHEGSVPTKKLHLSALRALFDQMVVRHAMLLNPAASVRGEKYHVIEGKTPEITVAQARTLIARIRTEKKTRNQIVPSIIGLRDRAIIGVLIYTAARAGAVAKLRLKDFIHDGALWTLRFAEKGGKSREIPVRHDDLERYILDYLVPQAFARSRAILRYFVPPIGERAVLPATLLPTSIFAGWSSDGSKTPNSPAITRHIRFESRPSPTCSPRARRWRTCSIWRATPIREPRGSTTADRSG